MKPRKQKLNSTKFLAAAILILFSSTLFAQPNFSGTTKKVKQAVGNLINGIKSENEGVKRSCIYFAGKYKVSKTVDALIDELENAETTESKYLISLSLYLIGEQKGIDAIQKVAVNDKDPRTRKLVGAVYMAHLTGQESDLVAHLIPQK